MNGIALLGSNTNVGKTWLGVRLYCALRVHFPRLRALKPIESGWHFETSDARQWLEAHDDETTLAEVCHWQLEEPVTPAEEFERLDTSLDEADLYEQIAAMAGRRPVVVETAGGVASPLCGSLTSAGLARLLGVRSLIITGNELGTISTTVTAYEYAVAHGARPFAIALNERSALIDESSAKNAKWIQRRVDVPVIRCAGSIPETLIQLALNELRASASR